MIKELECGSACTGDLARGCEYCIEGSKMVLFVTGECSWGCEYCPVSLEKKGKDVIYANEARVFTDEEIIAEAESMDAEGTGITGGDPLRRIDRTVRMIRLLKERFGEDHHIHLYTATIDPEKTRLLEEAGLDEIRFHPPRRMWTHMRDTALDKILSFTKMDAGIEIPAIPGAEDEIISLVDYAKSVGIKFVNLNELEFSESNWDMMDKNNYEIRDEISAAVLGSEECARYVMEKCSGIGIHFCSSPFKDGVQLRRRLIRKAENVCADYQAVTEDGTLIRGFLYAEDLLKAREELLSAGVEEDMIAVLDNKLEVAPWILEEIAPDLKYKCVISEQYPTADGLEVERTPLN
ncbi:MAG: radical SAM protein [Candidatus Methanomethylophilaceae archaeon]|nr:radical SAM protein [Candidatus Methanomethylophilaceae archaeon]